MEIEKLIDDYTQWLRKEITVEDVGNYYGGFFKTSRQEFVMNEYT